MSQKLILVSSLAFALTVLIGNGFAAIQTYQIVDTFSIDGFSAPWLHSGEGNLSGSTENGARRSGAISSRLSGILIGDLNGNQLTDISGSINGNLLQVSSYLNSSLGLASMLGASTSFEIKLGSSASGTGAL